jgi:Tfp pilus assembly protein PilF
MSLLTSEAKSAQAQHSPADPLLSASAAEVLRTPRGQTLLMVLLLVLATLLVYEPSLRNAFLNYDDPDYVTQNYYVLQGLSWHNLAWAFTTTAEANWHPLTWISHMADVQLFGLHATGHHLVNLLLHTLNVVLLFLLLRFATGSIFSSAAVAALFALCPLNVETVAWIAERKSLLCTEFFLLSLFAYGWYARRPGIARYLAVALFFALGLMAKPMVITLPALLLLADYWPLRRFEGGGSKSGGISPGRLLRLGIEKIPLLGLSLASAWVTIYAQRAGGALGTTALLPLGARVKNATYSYLDYILKGLWPVRLAVFYPHPENSLAWWKVAAAGFFVLATSLAVWRFRHKKYLLTGWLWYLGTMVPVIGIIQVGRQAMADRYTYIPFIGLFAALVWLCAEWAAGTRTLRAVAAAVAIVAISGWAYATHTQIGYWQNSYTLFSHALRVTTKNGVAEDNLGVALVEMGRPDLAIGHFQAAIEWMPKLSTAHYNFGTLLHRQNNLPSAVAEYRLALAYTGDPEEAARAHNNLGAALSQLDQLAAARAEYAAAIRINPNEYNSFLGRGMLEYRSGNLDAARSDFSRASEIAPSATALFWLGRASEDQGRLQAAASAYQSALKIAPSMDDAKTRLNEVRLKAQQ